MFTRSELLATSGMEAHRRYYAQLVKPYLLKAVEAAFGDRLLRSTNPHFSDTVPLAEWDHLTNIFYSAFEYRRILQELGDSDTLSTRVCVLKEAARQLVEQKRVPETA